MDSYYKICIFVKQSGYTLVNRFKNEAFWEKGLKAWLCDELLNNKITAEDIRLCLKFVELHGRSDTEFLVSIKGSREMDLKIKLEKET